MNINWFILTAAFAASLGLVTGGIIKNQPVLIIAGLIIGAITYLFRSKLT